MKLLNNLYMPHFGRVSARIVHTDSLEVDEFTMDDLTVNTMHMGDVTVTDETFSGYDQDIGTLQTTVGVDTTGLVGKVAALEGTVGTDTTGLVHTVAGHTTDISSLQATVTADLDQAVKTTSGVSFGSVAATGAVTGASVAATGAVTGASVAATGAVTGGSVSATGAVSGASITTTGAVTATGAVSGASVAATGAVTGASVAATGAVTGASVAATGAVTGGSVSATGAVSGASVTSTGAVSGNTLAATNGVTGASVTTPGAVTGNSMVVSYGYGGNTYTGTVSIVPFGQPYPYAMMFDASANSQKIVFQTPDAVYVTSNLDFTTSPGPALQVTGGVGAAKGFYSGSGIFRGHLSQTAWVWPTDSVPGWYYLGAYSSPNVRFIAKTDTGNDVELYYDSGWKGRHWRYAPLLSPVFHVYSMVDVPGAATNTSYNTTIGSEVAFDTGSSFYIQWMNIDALPIHQIQMKIRGPANQTAFTCILLQGDKTSTTVVRKWTPCGYVNTSAGGTFINVFDAGPTTDYNPPLVLNQAWVYTLQLVNDLLVSGSQGEFHVQCSTAWTMGWTYVDNTNYPNNTPYFVVTTRPAATFKDGVFLKASASTQLFMEHHNAISTHNLNVPTWGTGIYGNRQAIAQTWSSLTASPWFATTPTAPLWASNVSGFVWNDVCLMGGAQRGGDNETPTVLQLGTFYGWTWAFNRGDQDELHFTFQIPHNAVGPAIPHIHWSVGLGVLNQQAYWTISITGGQAHVSQQYLQSVLTPKITSIVPWTLYQTDFPALDFSNIAGYDFRPSGVFVVTLKRNSDGISDTINEDTYLMGIDFHMAFNSDAGGSLASYP